MTTTPNAAARVSGTIKAMDWQRYDNPHFTPGHMIANANGKTFVISDHGGMCIETGEMFRAASFKDAKEHADRLAAIQPDPEPQPVAQDTICDDCGKLVRHNTAHWMDDGASYCPSCRPLPATPSSAGTVSVEAAALENVLRRGRNITASMRIARTAIGDNADRGHLEAVALRYVRWQDLAFLDAALRALAWEGER